MQDHLSGTLDNKCRGVENNNDDDNNTSSTLENNNDDNNTSYIYDTMVFSSTVVTEWDLVSNDKSIIIINS